MKKVSDSRTEQVQILMPAHLGIGDRLFGGRLMEWIDVTASVAARRHSGCNVTTLFVDHLHFKRPAYLHNMLVLIAQLTYVGKTSMEVRVDSFVEGYDGSRELINRAYLVMVALDKNDRPTPVPGLCLQTDEEQAEWEAGKRRSEQRKAMR